ncbi:MAG: hypothetical protein A2V70_10400 [Planctomycetes bacterium RBG_13_63_9]|nr:MAG: hypothetical protein A2V70_10400 [Planctomycetes bacterium RBG_13_63_9]
MRLTGRTVIVATRKSTGINPTIIPSNAIAIIWTSQERVPSDNRAEFLQEVVGGDRLDLTRCNWRAN